MRPKRLEFSVRALRDLESIERYYLVAAGEAVAGDAVDAVLSQAENSSRSIWRFAPASEKGRGSV